VFVGGTRELTFFFPQTTVLTRFLRPSQAKDDVHVLIYETAIEGGVSPASRLVNQAEQLPGVSASVFGQGQHFDGYGSKYSAVLPVLKKMSADSLVVLSDGRDVLINNPAFSSEDMMRSALSDFRGAFETITSQHPHAVVVSAEAQCCVSALTFVQPGDYFGPDGSRQERACSSGEADCLWNGDDKAEPWENFMQTIALERTGGKAFDDVYLNAGLIAGKVEDLIHVIEELDIDNTEDDQAVLTDYMFQHQDAILLDYGQTLFGNNRAGEEDSCMFQLPSTSVRGQQRLVHTKTATSPLFVHSPGGLLKCHEELAEELGMQQVSRTARRRLLDSFQKSNYKGDDSSDSKDGDKKGGDKKSGDKKDDDKKSGDKKDDDKKSGDKNDDDKKSGDKESTKDGDYKDGGKDGDSKSGYKSKSK